MSGKGRLSPGKSYRLLHYLNRQHSLPERAVFATLGLCGCLTVTGMSTLGRQLAREFWQDNFKDGLRRAHWYATRGWPSVGSPDSDPFFCFSDGLSLQESRELSSWLERRASRLPDIEATTARLVALAQVVHQAGLEGQRREAEDAFRHFCDLADGLLARLDAARLAQGQADQSSRPTSSGAGGRSGDFALEDAERALQDVARLLPLDKWGWTALSGTFLGIFREGDFLPHDFDIDLGLRAAITDTVALREVLQASGAFQSVRVDYQYRLSRGADGFAVEEIPVLVKAVHRNGIAVDFSLLHEEDGVWWHGSMMHRWDHTPLELTDYQLRGVRILGPRDADRYLTECYGDWRTPVKSFNCSSGRHNLVVVRNLLGVCLFLKRLAWHLSQDDAEGYDAVLGQMLRQEVLRRDVQGALVTMNRGWFDQNPEIDQEAVR